MTEMSGQLNYHATNNFMVFGAVEYEKDSGHAYWGTPLVPTSFAGANAATASFPVARSARSAATIIAPVTINARTLTTNYNVADNPTGAQELWVRSGFEWSPLNNVTIEDPGYSWQTKASWLDSETYAFDDGAGIRGQHDRSRSLLRLSRSKDDTVTTPISHGTRISSAWTTGLAAQLQMSRNSISSPKKADFNGPPGGLYPADNVSVIDPSPGTYNSAGPVFRARYSR